MRILLDESLPRDLRAQLPGHDIATVVGCGWSGIKNGKLLVLAATRFDVFLTADQNLEFQANGISTRRLRSARVFRMGAIRIAGGLEVTWPVGSIVTYFPPRWMI